MVDPVATLIKLRRLITGAEDDDEIANTFRDLDEWMSKGGFSPWEAEIRTSWQCLHDYKATRDASVVGGIQLVCLHCGERPRP